MTEEKPPVLKKGGNYSRKKLIMAGGGIFAIIAITAVYLVSSGPQLDNVNGGLENMEPSRVYVEYVDGKPQLFVNGEQFMIRGVAYSPTPVGQSAAAGYNWWEDPETYTNDFPLLKQMGANTIRTYSSTDATKEALDAAYSNGIYVIMGYWVNHYATLSNPSIRQNMINEFVSIVRKWENHPAVLMWSFGNEVEYNYSGDAEDWYTLLQEAAQAAHAEEGENYHPVTTAHIDISNARSYIGDATKKADDASLSALDVWGLNAYRGYTFGTFFTDYASKSSKPFIMTEFGCDAWDGRAGAEDQSTQASYFRSLWLEIERNLTPAGLCLGGTVFEWCDEWWKAGMVNVHTTTAQWQNGAYADPNMNEEWWGVTSVSPDTYVKTPREAYHALKELWTTATSDFNISVSPAGSTLQPDNSAEATVLVSARGTYTENVSLSATGQPSGVTVEFAPTSGTPSFSSTMTINVGATAAEGSYTITITGTGADDKTHTCTYSLVVSTVSIQPYEVYDDSGIPSGGEVWTWHGGSGSFNGSYIGESVPEGTKCFQTTSANWAGWGVFLIYPSHHTVDLSSYSSLKFWVKTPADLKVEIEAPEGVKQTKYLTNYGWDGTNTWQEITIPASDFTNLEQVYSPLLVTIENTGTFYIDYVRWVV